MKKTTGWQRGFTLIELLVVIAIIGILSLVMFTSLKGAMNAAKNARAMSQMQALEGAIKRYYAEYNKMPAPGPGFNGSKDMEKTVFTGSDQAKIIEILINSPNVSDPTANPRQIVFLDLDTKAFHVNTQDEVYKELKDGEPYRDPWWDPNAAAIPGKDHSYGILMDFNFNGVIEGAAEYGDIRAPVAVFSFGNPEKVYKTVPAFKTW